MALDPTKLGDHPEMKEPRLVLGFSGWMDGGEVSTGTIEYLRKSLRARRLAEIDSDGFYLAQFPGSMEVSALFRPQVKIEDGLITDFQEPTNRFAASPDHRLILFSGKEPNLRWKEYGDALLDLARQWGVTMIYFVGSVAGAVPHTREPRFFASVSEDSLRPALLHYGIKPSNYEGPASIVTYLMVRAREKGLKMASLVAEIPAYVQGKNFKGIEAMLRKLSVLLDLSIRLTDLETICDELEKKITELVKDRTDLAAMLRKLEEDYDNEVFDSEMGDLKTWLEQQGIELE